MVLAHGGGVRARAWRWWCSIARTRSAASRSKAGRSAESCRVVRGAGRGSGPPRADHRRDGAAACARACPGAAARFARPLDCDLTVVPMRGWRRAMDFDETGLPWVMPSPNMPTLGHRASSIPGSAWSRGPTCPRGAAPRGRSRSSARRSSTATPGRTRLGARCSCRACGFGRCRSGRCSTSSRGQSCGGVQLHVTDRGGVSPLRDRASRSSRRRAGWRPPTSAGGRSRTSSSPIRRPSIC